jgi:hypothetical protein
LLPEQETARARAHAYTLFQRLFLEGLTRQLLPYARAIPALAQALGLEEEAGAFDPDGAAADHYQLLGYNVYPYESAFLAAEASLGGAVTEGVFAFYQELGLSGIGRSESPDHIGLELGCLAFLASAEVDARQDGLPSQAARMQALQRRFLEEHLLGWLPGLVQAIRSQGSAFYTALAELALELALAHHSDLAAVAPARVFHLPPPPDLLGDERTGVKEIARYLLTTAWSGLYLSREDIARLARRRHLPRGFGDRQVMLADLLRVAADYERLPDVLDDLGEQVGQWQQAYQAQRAAGHPLAHYAEAWLARLDTTARLLERIRSAAG